MSGLVGYDYSDGEEEEETLEHEVKAVNSDKPDPEPEPKPELKNSGPSSSLQSIAIKASGSKNGRIQIKAFSREDLINQQDSDDSEDEERRERKRLKKSEKGSTLISMLPKPKNKSAKKLVTTSLVPNSVSNRSKLPKPVLNIPNKRPEEEQIPKSFFFNDDSDDDDDDYAAARIIPEPRMETLSEPVIDDATPVYGPAKPPDEDLIPEQPIHLDPNDDVTYKKFIASKFDDSSQNIKIVDVDLSKHLSENKDWLKNISLEKDINGEDLPAPNSTARRKNQITFLAYQAKKRELELKNQWAQNRATKSQTRSKYGF